jgi:hypothetical protein
VALDSQRAFDQEVTGRAPGPLQIRRLPSEPELGPEAPVPARRRRWPWIFLGACVAVALVHSYVVGHYYFVGSFDDDANYILTAKALISGQGLTGHLINGDPVVGSYPPGFPLLIVPIELLRAHSYVPFQVLSALCFAMVLPLTWVYLGRRGLPDVVRVAAVALLALNPVMATFGAMVMAETPFLVCLLVFLLALDLWERTPRVLSPIGVLTVLIGAETVWLKEAGLAFVLGVGLWFVLRRRIAKGVAVVAGLVITLVPVIVARVIDGVPLAGARYSAELGTYYSGGLASQLIHVLPSASWQWLTVALPATVLPSGAPLPTDGIWGALISVVVVQVAGFTVAGFVIAARRYRDATIVAVPAYILETVLWPEVNERRVILVLPVLMAWYALGVRAAVLWTVARWRARRRSLPALRTAWAVLGLVVVVVPLVLQFPRDYLFDLGQASSRPEGSRYTELLYALHPHATLVETDYKYTVALLTGHHTADNAFLNVILDGCSETNARKGLATDDAGFLLIGAVNKPYLIDNACLFGLATSRPWAVRLLRTDRDEASVFELIGPGTAHPGLVNRLAGARLSASGGLEYVPVRSAGAGDNPGAAETTAAAGGRGTFTWSFGRLEPVSQVSVGEAGTTVGLARGVELQIHVADGTWRTVASAPRAVGDGRSHTPFLLVHLPAGTVASGFRVVVDGTGRLVALDAAALGPRAAGGA